MLEKWKEELLVLERQHMNARSDERRIKLMKQISGIKYFIGREEARIRYETLSREYMSSWSYDSLSIDTSHSELTSARIMMPNREERRGRSGARIDSDFASSRITASSLSVSTSDSYSIDWSTPTRNRSRARSNP